MPPLRSATPALAKRPFSAGAHTPRRFLRTSNHALSTRIVINPTYHPRTTPFSTLSPRLNPSKESGSTRPEEAKTESADKEPSVLPSFSLKDMSPTVRYWFIGVFVVLGLLEGAAWVKVLPKMYNKETPSGEEVTVLDSAVESKGK